MASAGMTYLNEIHQRFAYLPTWLPNAKLQLGDVGVLRGEGFRQMTTLKELGVPFTTRRGAAALDFSYTSASGVALQMKAKGVVAPGTTLPAAKAGVEIKFRKQGHGWTGGHPALRARTLGVRLERRGHRRRG
jgi:hypothetical protein